MAEVAEQQMPGGSDIRSPKEASNQRELGMGRSSNDKPMAARHGKETQ